MEKRKLLVTMKDIKRYKILRDVIEKRLKGIEAACILSLTPVHISRLKSKVIRGGFESLLRIPPKRPPNKKIPETDIRKILKLRKSLYYDFNIMHFMDKLHEVHKITYCYESIRAILVKENLHNPKKRHKVHRQRRRMPKSGLLIQMDSSEHKWLAHIKEKWHLIAMIDDATNEVAQAGFFSKDTLFNNMRVLRQFIEKKGLFMSLYVDKASHFKTTRHGGLCYNIAQEQEETQIERALNELDINIIPANSPQAKGRIEVTFRLFQDRLIKEMRLAKVKDYSQADKFLKDSFLPWYNSKYTHPAESAYSPLPQDKNLDIIFCIKKTRTVNNDNTVQIYNHIIQILPSKLKRTFAKLKVDVCLLEDNSAFVLYKGTVIARSNLSEENKVIRKEKRIEKLLSKREYGLTLTRVGRKLPQDHPWYGFRLRNSTPRRKLTFQTSKKLTC